MSDFTSFIELLIKQTCRRASYEFGMGSKQSTEDSSSIYSLEFLKSLYDKPRDNIHKLLKIPDNTIHNVKVANGLNWMTTSEFSKVERKMLLEFLNKVKDMSPSRSQQWIDLQHYMHYVYRNFANGNPDPSAEVLSSFFVTEIKELVKSLMQEDESQLYLRILAILREYCIFAQWNYSKSDEEHTITKLFYYYEAMLSAAKNLSTVFSELEIIIYKNYSVCWIDFNTCVFIRYFFETEYVQNKIYQCLETKVSPGDTLAMIDDLNLSRLDHQIFRLLGDPTFHPAGPILDRNGQCICEECLIAKYKCILDSSQDQLNDKILKNIQRLSYCRRCQNLVDLDYFHRHINSHAVSDLDHSTSLLLSRSTSLSRIISEKIDFVKLGNGSPNLPDLLASEPPVFKNTCDIHFSKSNGDVNNDMDSTKVAFEEFLKHRKETANKSEQILNKNVRNFIKIKKDIFNHSSGNFTGKVFDNVFKQTTQSPPYPISCKSALAAPKPACEHSCKHEEEAKANICQGHGATCDHHKESKKCDCTYCEVFGTSVTSHSHKNNELRDRLRIRLHQRREKRTKDTCKNPPAAAANTNNLVKIKTVINKVEERVPLPSSPTNIPPAPSVKSSDSSITTSSATDDIHGLVNYIEGNTGLNKMELAEKKAAKKARQRLKKEEERIKAEEEQKRIAEELKRKEAEKKKELARKLAEKEKARALLEAAAKIEAKKKSKKERQAEKRQQADKQVKLLKRSSEDKTHILEETIPRDVTITLKGSTPDQDKLLYTLVNGSDENPASKETDTNQNNASSKKKKKKKQQVTQPASTVITKELKVTLALDSNKTNTGSTAVNASQETRKPNRSGGKVNDNKKPANKQKEGKKDDRSHEDLQIPMLRLPPGVIVVDTEKLIQNKQSSDTAQAKSAKAGKKSRKKKNKKQPETHLATPTTQTNRKMVTLKNPIFQSFQAKPEPPPVDKNSDGCAPAAIFTNENGMVTIRSSRLQQSLSNGAALNPMPMMSMPNLLPDLQKPKKNPNPYVPIHQNINEEKNEVMSPFNAQEILSGLPGIEITKVDKKAVKSELDSNKSCQTAQVSIIPASNGGEKFSFDKDDWLYDSVFTPRDVLEDDMDAEELELEAFKRFCQQSIPPKRKEKVAHLNVADIVLKRKLTLILFDFLLFMFFFYTLSNFVLF
ncbi:hypothetical protein NQ314_020774 [Rhamnusium bicolor]|uniref:FAM193 C-terminal domain-containing protein n=1 Tax=Rhamnusium bicolor TaxID=1586634 RepID=A0AAV8WLG3_9CUCU|nr:hypothetical protein NQ314_020774 [Rhamnusium bicolor]